MFYTSIKHAHVFRNSNLTWNIIDPVQYRKSLIFTLEVRKKIMEKLYDFPYKITNILFEMSQNKRNISCQLTVLYACYFRKQDLKEMRAMLTKIVDSEKKKCITVNAVDIILTRCQNPDLESLYICQLVAQYLDDGIGHRKLNRVATRCMREKALGCLIEIKGRINGHAITRKDRVILGRVSRNTVGRNISYAKLQHNSKSGAVGIKVWINREIQKEMLKKNIIDLK